MKLVYHFIILVWISKIQGMDSSRQAVNRTPSSRTSRTNLKQTEKTSQVGRSQEVEITEIQQKESHDKEEEKSKQLVSQLEGKIDQMEASIESLTTLVNALLIERSTGIVNHDIDNNATSTSTFIKKNVEIVSSHTYFQHNNFTSLSKHQQVSHRIQPLHDTLDINNVNNNQQSGNNDNNNIYNNNDDEGTWNNKTFWNKTLFMSKLNSISKCTKRHLQSTTLQKCINLAPAGTGTSTLTAALKPYSHHVHHNHKVKLSGQNDILCFIMTLREPAERLLSGIRFNYLKYSTGFQKRFGTNNINEIINAMRDKKYKHHQHWLHFLQTSFFGTAFKQFDYLNGNKCDDLNSKREIHFICNQRETQDIEHLFRNIFGKTSYQSISKKAGRSNQIEDKGMNMIQISDLNRVWLNQHVFYEDMLLFERFCS